MVRLLWLTFDSSEFPSYGKVSARSGEFSKSGGNDNECRRADSGRALKFAENGTGD
jgi:hypothetical protein